MSACVACATENPADARFCMSCGSPLERRCPSCGARAAAGARFCTDCGAPLAADGARAGNGAGAAADEAPAAGAATATPPPAAPAPEGALAGAQSFEERRTATVLFADLAGYTAVAEKLDPESVKRLLERILGRLGEEVTGFG